LNLFRRLGYLNKTGGIAVPGCGVDITHFTPRDRNKDSRTIFTFIGRLLVDKGINEFVAAAQLIHSKNPNTLFRIVGNLDEDNPAHISPNQLAVWRRMPGIEYLGYAEDPRFIYADTDWVVLPSYREGLSRVLLEALAMGRPIITTDTPGCREVVDPGNNGYLVPIRNTQALSIAFETAFNLSQQEWQVFCAFSRRKAVTEFESLMVGQMYADLIRTIFAQQTKIKSHQNESA
jgi:glycosyltransferase involved in cell wall biosynthesis